MPINTGSALADCFLKKGGSKQWYWAEAGYSDIGLLAVRQITTCATFHTVLGERMPAKIGMWPIPVAAKSCVWDDTQAD